MLIEQAPKFQSANRKWLRMSSPWGRAELADRQEAGHVCARAVAELEPGGGLGHHFLKMVTLREYWSCSCVRNNHNNSNYFQSNSLHILIIDVHMNVIRKCIFQQRNESDYHLKIKTKNTY